MTTNIMVDLETYGLVPGQALRSIAAVEFDVVTGDIVSTFYRNVVDDRPRDRNTEAWWDTQPEEAQAALNLNKISLGDALIDLANWWKSQYTPVWCNGAAFDIPHLEVAFHHASIAVPWHYRAVRCVRTLFEIVGDRPDPVVCKADGGVLVPSAKLTPHYALHDCYYQIEQVVEVFNSASLKPLKGAK